MGPGGVVMTEREREIEAVLRAVPLVARGASDFNKWQPDYPAMACAVAEAEADRLRRAPPWWQHVSELATVCQRHGCMWEVHEGCEVRIAKGDARLARLVAAAYALETKLDAMEWPINVCLITAVQNSAPYTGPTWTEERLTLRAALADAGAEKERWE